MNELEKAGIEPFVTLYHHDLPQNFERFGGWLNETTAYLFSDYARFIFQEFGHRVKLFATINEPTILCSLSYEKGIHAPGKIIQFFKFIFFKSEQSKCNVNFYFICNIFTKKIIHIIFARIL